MTKQMFFSRIPTQQGPSFRLIPISSDCNFLDIVFEKDQKILRVVNKEKFDTMRLIKKLDKNGQPKPLIENGKKIGFIEEQKQVMVQYDYAIIERSEIEQFVEIMTGEKHDLEEYFKPLELAPDPNPPGLNQNLIPDATKLSIVKDEVKA